MKARNIRFVGPALLLAFFITGPLLAQEATSLATNCHSLWKVEGKTNVVYLLGSIHLLKPENFPLAPPLETAFSNSQVAVFETDVEKMEDPEVQARLLNKAQLPAGETIQQHLSPETYASFVNEVNASGLPMEAVESMKPSMAVMVLGIVEITKMGASPQNGLDKYFSNRAHKEGKEVIGLETLDFQMDLITGFTKEEEDLVVKTALKDMSTVKKQFGDILAAWQIGNAPAIEKLLNDAVHEAPSLYRRLVSDRNKSWVPVIEKLVEGGQNAVVIVGVAHLVGKDGVVELLRQKGLKVTQL